MKQGVFIGIITLLLLNSGCSRHQAAPETLRSVKVDTVAVYGESKNVTFPGKIIASADMNLAFRVSGPIAGIYVDVGQQVKKGQALAEIDPRDYRVQLSATEAEYNQIKNQADRIAELYKRKSISANDYDKALYGYRQISAKLEAHKNALRDTKLLAPSDGYIQKRLFEVGETVGAGTPVMSMISANSGEVEINIPSTDYVQRDMFDSYYCTVDIYPGKTFPLELIGITQKANMNQLYTMRFRLTGEERGVPGAGMSTMVTIVYKSNNSELVTVPLSAVFESSDGSSVWVYNADSQTVAGRKVKVEQILIDGTAVISGGLSKGDIVVSAGVNSLEEGEKVKLLPAASHTNVGGML